MVRRLAAALVRTARRRAALRDEDDAAVADDNSLPSGHMKLYRNCTPLLLPGSYGIEAQQIVNCTIQGTTNSIIIYNYDPATVSSGSTEAVPAAPTILQKFEVIAPQFHINPEAVDSVYPPPGFADEQRVLPHIVFNDPHIPWDRRITLYRDVTHSVASSATNIDVSPLLTSIRSTEPPGVSHRPQSSEVLPNAGAAPGVASTVTARLGAGLLPWFALMVFDVDELRLTPAEEAGLSIPIPEGDGTSNIGSVPQLKPSTAQVTTPATYSMTVKDYLTKVNSRIYYEADGDFQSLTQSNEPTSIIFPTKQIAKTLFGDLLQFYCLSHVREISNTGLPDSDGEGKRSFAVCISRRTGQTTYATTTQQRAPTTKLVHLVSLEHLVQSLSRDPLPGERIGLVSLYSWTYLSIPPPNPINFLTTMENLAADMQMLNVPTKTLSNLRDSIDSQPSADAKVAAQVLSDRLSVGYTIGRWRTAVGQEVVAFNRGPLTPLGVPLMQERVSDWPDLSNSGKDYQILDERLGVMDVSYSSAWQLGRLLAISDNVFNSALLRFRSLVHEKAASAARFESNSMRRRDKVITALSQSLDELLLATEGKRQPQRNVLGKPNRLANANTQLMADSVFRTEISNTVRSLSLSGSTIFTDYDLEHANNPDWEIIHKWISDKLFLGGIPSHYMITDPSQLPSEALRFFYIDDTWIDCLLDGALSVANHLEPAEDFTRRTIKEVYNAYLLTDLGSTQMKPPVPKYGFILRSSILKVMPSIRVTVTCRTGNPPDYEPDDTREPLLRLTKMDEFTLFALLDCLPEEIFAITLTQPPHQQRFVAGGELDQTPEWTLRTLYTQNAPQGNGDAGQWPPLNPVPALDVQATWYDTSTHCLDAVKMTTALAPALASADYTNDPDPVALALELNDSSYQLTIKAPAGTTLASVSQKTRKIWVKEDSLPVPVAGGVQNVPRKLAIHEATSVLPPVLAPIMLDLSATHIFPGPFAEGILATSSSEIISNFKLAVHPDYRGSSPLPLLQSNGTMLYSAWDFIPTEAESLFDLIFSVHRRDPIASLPYPLVSLSFHITSATSDDPGIGATVTTEPFLVDNPGSPRVRASMIHNKRLICFLTTNPGGLDVTLTSRTAPLGGFEFIQDNQCREASFRLTGCRIVKTQSPVPISIVGSSSPEERGLCSVQMTETYAPTNVTRASVTSKWDVVKRAGGDVDLAGKPV